MTRPTCAESQTLGRVTYAYPVPWQLIAPPNTRIRWMPIHILTVAAAPFA